MKLFCLTSFVFALVALSFPSFAFTVAASEDFAEKETAERTHLRRTSGTSAEPNEASLLLTPRFLTVKTLVIVGDDGNPASAFPLGQCQGDCDTDDDCLGSLKCFQRQKGDDIRKVPGCKTNNVTKLTSGGTDFCYNPNDLPATPTPVRSPVRPPVQIPTQGTLDFVGEDWKPRSAYPLQLCEGDCDGDFDCAGELVCHQRDKNAVDPVPGCAGQDTTTRDYCVRASDDYAQPPVSGAFRNKLFWRYGYKWQDEFWEQEWCMECTGGANNCEVNDSIIISSCSNVKSTWFLYKNLKNEVTQLQVATTGLCLEWVNNKDILLKSCDGSKDRQKFKALNGTFEGMKYEISTASEEGCLAQQHHPKDGELIYRQPCALTRKHTTSFWTHY